jgi:recombinational DNA repair protein RecR
MNTESGLPVGGGVEYADELALDGHREVAA